MKTKSKILVLILTLALLCGAIALIASAETTGTVVSTPEELTAAWTTIAKNGGTITLKNDIEYPNTLEMPENGRTMTLDLGGHKLTYTGTADIFMDVKAWSRSEYTVTVKNGTISVGAKVKAIRVFNEGGTKTKNANFENLTVTNTATDTAFPENLVHLQNTTVNMTNVYISGKAKDLLFIAAGSYNDGRIGKCTVTAVNTTVRNAVIPEGDGTIGRAAIFVKENNTVTMTNCLVESVYTGIRFENSNDAAKNTFLFKDSTLNVTLKRDIVGEDLSAVESPVEDPKNPGKYKKYNAGYVNKILIANPTTITLDGARVIGTSSGRLVANEGSISNIKSMKAHVVYRNSFLYGGNWGRNCYVTLEGTNLFFGGATPGYKASAYVRATAGSRSYFTSTFDINAAADSNGTYSQGYGFLHDNTDYPTPSAVALDKAFSIASDCGDRGPVTGEFQFALLAPDATITGAAALAEFESRDGIGAKTYDASGNLCGLSFGDSLNRIIPEGGTLRLVRDVTVPALNAKLIEFKTTSYFDLNGHWLSLGGAPAFAKSEAFSVAKDTYVYTSQPGGGIRLLAISENADKSFQKVTDKSMGAHSLFTVSGGAHLHLGYKGENEYSNNGFSVISSVMAQSYNGGKVTIKGGNYYRSFWDNHAFFDIRTLSGNNANLLTAEDAYFYGSTYIIGGHLTTAGAICDGVTASFENCKIDAPVIAAAGENKFANSTVTLTNCDILRNQAAVAGVNLAFGEGCRYPSTVSIPQVATGVKGGVMINDTALTYRGARRITLAQATEGLSSFTEEATITLNRKVTANYATLTFVSGTESETELWEKGETPPQIEDTLIGDNYIVTYGTIETVTEDATYTARVISKESRIKGNLTLYANITFNLYFQEDGFIKGVRYNEKETLFTDADRVQVDGVDYFLFRINDIAPKELSKAFRLDVIVEGSTATYTVMTSLVKYADSVLKNASESAEGKTLVKALLDYVRETSVALGDVSTESMGIKAIDACLAKYGYTRTEWKKPESVITPATGDVKGAALELLNMPGFVFFLNDTYADKNSVTVTVNGVTKDYTITHKEGKHFFTVDNIHISNYRKDLTVKLGEQSFTYNFDVYMAGFTTVPAYAHALYAYSVAAEAYLATQTATN